MPAAYFFACFYTLNECLSFTAVIECSTEAQQLAVLRF